MDLIHDGVDEKRRTERWLEPLWHGDTMWYESCMVISDNDGSEPYVPLLFEPENIVTVHHSRMDVQYEEGRDYALKDGRLIFPHGSGVPVVSRRELIMEEEAPGESMPGREGGYVLFHEGSYFHDRQIAVTYMHSRTGWQGPVPTNQSRLLPHTARKLASGEKFKLVVYGDSITEGANASGAVGAPPYMPAWPQLVAQDLNGKYPAEVHLTNMAKGGMQSDWGRANAGDVAELRPDLTIIAFGMNDGTHGRSAADFKANIESIMDTIRAKKKDAEFVLVSPMLANPATFFAGNQAAYVAVLQPLSGPGRAFVDVTSLHAYLLRHKRYADMTGNHINHPNDFLSRLYAQAITAIWNA